MMDEMETRYVCKGIAIMKLDELINELNIPS